MTHSEFFRRHIAAFRSRDFDRMQADYACPFAIYVADRLVSFPTRRRIATGLRDYDAALRDMGVVRAEPRIEAISLPRRTRQVVWVRWRRFDAAGGESGGVRMRYFFAPDANARPQIHLVEVLGTAGSAISKAMSHSFRAA